MKKLPGKSIRILSFIPIFNWISLIYIGVINSNTMKSLAQEKREPNVFYVHHGSVSAALRKEAESALRNGVGPTVAAATLTLELGIDIGDLDSTIQIGAPYSCASFVQRLGRSGRRTGKPQMMFVDLQNAPTNNPFDSLPCTL